jgi:hypothetical protein
MAEGSSTQHLYRGLIVTDPKREYLTAELDEPGIRTRCAKGYEGFCTAPDSAGTARRIAGTIPNGMVSVEQLEQLSRVLRWERCQGTVFSRC